jgi:hypothetical protein
MPDDLDTQAAHAALRAYRELVRVARDPGADPMLPHLLAALREAEPGLRSAVFAARDAWQRTRRHWDLVIGLGLNTVENLRALDEADAGVAGALMAYRVAHAEWVEVYLILHPGHVPPAPEGPP